jgi:hypothetical protein
MPLYSALIVAAIVSCALATQSAALVWQIDKARAEYDLRIAKCVEEALIRTKK